MMMTHAAVTLAGPHFVHAVADGPLVLVVDDDAVLLDMFRRFLERRGFRVLSANGGRRAVELIREHAGRVAMALIDVRMPDLDGPQTLAALREIDAELRCCFMSGHTGDYSHDDLFALGCVRFFAKPFSLAAMADEVWQIATEAAVPA